MIRAYVSDDNYGIGVQVAIVLRAGDDERSRATQIMRFRDGIEQWEELPEIAVTSGPTLRLDHDSARALLDGLSRYFDGAEDTRALRHDYDSERGRVDKLTDAVIELARELATP
jgi:hypothetical protein